MEEVKTSGSYNEGDWYVPCFKVEDIDCYCHFDSSRFIITSYSIHISIEIKIFDINIAHNGNVSDGEETHEDDDGNVSG